MNGSPDHDVQPDPEPARLRSYADRPVDRATWPSSSRRPDGRAARRTDRTGRSSSWTIRAERRASAAAGLHRPDAQCAHGDRPGAGAGGLRVRHGPAGTEHHAGGGCARAGTCPITLHRERDALEVLGLPEGAAAATPYPSAIRPNRRRPARWVAASPSRSCCTATATAADKLT